MNFSYYPGYRFLTSALYWLLLPFSGAIRVRGSGYALAQRLGKRAAYPDASISGAPRLWLHAASVGEVRAAVGIVAALKRRMPECGIVFSTMSRTGQEIAREQIGAFANCVYAPLDFVRATRAALAFSRPDILVCMETEIWPNWLYEARRAGIKTVIVNGRISGRSINRYQRIRPLIRPILAKMDAFSMISTIDADRIIALGALPGRVSVNGNAKFDLLIKHRSPAARDDFFKLLNLSGPEAVIVAGSTRSSEEEVVLDAYADITKAFPDALLIIAPRHVERSYQIEALVKARGVACQLRSELDARLRPRIAPVVIMDTMGELQSLYSIASVAFCGGSLAPLGGHNILEAAVWGKTVLYGPHMDDFPDARELLESAGAGYVVRNAGELAGTVVSLLKTPEKTQAAGEKAVKAILENEGASERHTDVIVNVLRS